MSSTDLRDHLSSLLQTALASVLPNHAGTNVLLERPKQMGHGDYACNLALQLAKSLKRSPRDIASELVLALPGSAVLEKAEIAGAGFINLFLRPAARQAVVAQVMSEADRYGCHRSAADTTIQIEFVSANPTGPLHVGHGRGAAYGASLANVLAASGARVSREFYINDAGRQLDILALSVWLRYLERCGHTVEFPQDGYRGDYIYDIARSVEKTYGEQLERAFLPRAALPGSADADAALDEQIAAAKALLGDDWRKLHRLALDIMLADQRDDLAGFQVSFDSWFSEQSLYDSGAVARVVQQLAERGHLYEKDGALWFRSTDFGDEKDRVVRRENGQYTYFASDIAYHAQKFECGFRRMINVWGADHHGYIARVKGALTALGLDAERLTITLVQFAVLYRAGQKVSMGKRSGDFVTLRQLREEVGNDAARFFYVLRKSDQHLDFDLDLAKSQSNDNPVYYIQYAHARVCSVLEEWEGEVQQLEQADLSPLISESELVLLRQLMDYPVAVDEAVRDLAPHVIAFYLRDLAGLFHSYYNGVRFLVDDESMRFARLALIVAVRQVLRNGLRMLGVSAPEKM